MRVLVCTVVHNPADARIFYRQIRALLDAGHEVTYIAPHPPPQGVRGPGEAPPGGYGGRGAPHELGGFGGDSSPRASGFGGDSSPRASGSGGDSSPRANMVPVPRAVGRRRLAALLAARREIARHAPSADILLIHDPELLLALPPRRRRPPVVWDVHEDTAAALSTKAWLPRWLRPPVAAAVIAAERIAERRLHLILAEDGYSKRFARQHLVVPNTTYVPAAAAAPDGEPRVIYVGHLSPDRGVAEMIEMGRLLAPHGIAVHLAGPADNEARALLEAVKGEGEAGGVTWHGFVPNDEAMRLVDGALAGLSLLRDEANFRHSMPTKVVEYMARGVPVITTPLPRAAELVESADCGFVVPFEDAAAASDAALRLAADRDLRVKMGTRGHEAALASYAWPVHARPFVTQLERWAAARADRQ